MVGGVGSPRPIQHLSSSDLQGGCAPPWNFVPGLLPLASWADEGEAEDAQHD